FLPVALNTPAWRRIGDIGVIELSQIRDKATFDRALQSLVETRGLVLHGFPDFGGGPTELTRRIIRTPLARPRYSTPLVLGSQEHSMFGWLTGSKDTIVPVTEGAIRKPVAMLIDGSMQSSAEGWLSLIKSAKAATFVGSQTAGANGGVTSITLAGGGIVQFT